MALATQLPARLAAGDTTFTAGVGEVAITPDVKMTNHYTAHKPFGVVHDPLHVRALVIGDGATRGALLVWDLLDAGNSAVARAREEIEKVTGIPASQVIINATHTHCWIIPTAAAVATWACRATR
jgi:hypothetical protein